MSQRSNAFKFAVLGGIVALAVVLFLVLKSGNDNKSGSAAKEPAPATIVIKGGKPVGGVQKLQYVKGQTVRFTVRSDVADEVHVHGYNFMKNVKAGGSVSFSFPATIEGDFEAELEGRKEQIIDLKVEP